MERHSIVHLTGDFPDPVNFHKTRVIERLVDLTSSNFDHTVFSINRVSPGPMKLTRSTLARSPLEICAEHFAYGTALSYIAPAKGVFHVRNLLQLGDWLAEQILKLDRKPRLLMGHKLTIEGIAAHRAAKKLGIPFAITIQSHTDNKILRARPDLRSQFRRIYDEAALVVAFTPIAFRQVDAILGPRHQKYAIIPCPTDLDAPLEPRKSETGLLSVFHLQNYRTKNLRCLIKAVKIANKGGATCSLDIVGGGEEDEVARCLAMIGQEKAITLAGPLDRRRVRKRMNEAKAFVMPSLSESFGLVFIEALFAGLPIIYPANRSVDGYFDEHDFAIRVDPRNPDAIAKAINFACDNEMKLKESLTQWQRSGEAQRFTRPAISEAFRSALNSVCEG